MTPIPVERTAELDTPLGKDEAPRATAPSAVLRAPSWRALLKQLRALCPKAFCHLRPRLACILDCLFVTRSFRRCYQRIPPRAADGTTFPATNYGSEIRVIVSP